MGTNGGTKPLMGLEIDLVFCFVELDKTVAWGKYEKTRKNLIKT